MDNGQEQWTIIRRGHVVFPNTRTLMEHFDQKRIGGNYQKFFPILFYEEKRLQASN